MVIALTLSASNRIHRIINIFASVFLCSHLNFIYTENYAS